MIAPTELDRLQMRRIARTLLEDIGSMGLLLAPGPAVDESLEVIGQRLLDSFDALAALGSSVDGAVHEPDLRSVIESYASEVDPPDAARRFATSFALSHLRRARSR